MIVGLASAHSRVEGTTVPRGFIGVFLSLWHEGLEWD
jgi:hypothetical protein